MKSIHYNESFNKISEEKRNKILESAIIEFSEHNFDSANINSIAKRSGISIGSMYSYFNSKEDLFFTVVHYAVVYLNSIIQNIALSNNDIFNKIEDIIKAIQSSSRANAPLIKLYSQMTCENRPDLIDKIVSEIENVTAGLYANFVKDAQDKGLIRKDVDAKLFAFFIDNLFISLQFSYCSNYYKERLKIFVGEEILDNDDLVAEQLMKFIKGALLMK